MTKPKGSVPVSTTGAQPTNDLDLIDAPPPLRTHRLENGMLVGFCDREDFYHQMETQYPDEFIYYVLANVIEDREYEALSEYGHNIIKKHRDVTRLKIMKVVRNTVGMSIRELDPVEATIPLGLTNSVEGFTIYLPAIPRLLLTQVETFLRAIDHDMRCEAIVLLCYDPTVGGMDGWGVLVPDQKNNGGHCAYELESVMQTKPDEAEIVGTIHSHPGMSAFASHTDHQDQEGLDGIHITMGWRGRNGPIEYHCEFQQMGKHWDIKPGNLFEPVPDLEADEEVSEWIRHVELDVPKVGTTSPSNTGSGTLVTSDRRKYLGTDPLRTTTGGVWEYLRQHGTRINKTAIEKAAAELYPGECWVYGAVLSQEMRDMKTSKQYRCPFCGQTLLTSDIEQGACAICYNLLIIEPSNGYGVEKIVVRTQALFDWTSMRARFDLTLAPWYRSYRESDDSEADLKGLVLFDLRFEDLTKRFLPVLDDAIEIYPPIGTYKDGVTPAPPVVPAAGGRRPFAMWGLRPPPI